MHCIAVKQWFTWCRRTFVSVLFVVFDIFMHRHLSSMKNLSILVNCWIKFWWHFISWHWVFTAMNNWLCTSLRTNGKRWETIDVLACDMVATILLSVICHSISCLSPLIACHWIYKSSCKLFCRLCHWIVSSLVYTVYSSSNCIPFNVGSSLCYTTVFVYIVTVHKHVFTYRILFCLRPDVFREAECKLHTAWIVGHLSIKCTPMLVISWSIRIVNYFEFERIVM